EGRARHAERQEDRFEESGDRRLADPTEAEGRHGDAELAAGEIGLDVAQHPLQQLCAEALLLGERVDAESPALHQRELRGDIEAVGGEQEDGNREVEERAAHPAIFSSRNARTSLGARSLAMKAWPMPRVRMKVSRPRDTFLSCAISSMSRFASCFWPGMSAISVGRPTSARWAAT